MTSTKPLHVIDASVAATAEENGLVLRLRGGAGGGTSREGCGPSPDGAGSIGTGGPSGPIIAAPGIVAPGIPAPVDPAPGIAVPGIAAPGIPAPGDPAPGIAAPGIATIDGKGALQATSQVMALSLTQTPTLSMNLNCHVHRIGQHNLQRSANHKGPSASEIKIESYVQQHTAQLKQDQGACAPSMVREHSAAS